MSRVIIIDPSVSNRASLIHQLGLIKSFDISQFSDFRDARGALVNLANFKGLLFSALGEGIEVLSIFVQSFREINQEACLIVIVSDVTHEDVKSIIQLGVDQILVRPFNTNQLREKITAAENFRAKVQIESALKPLNSQFEVKVDDITDKFYRIDMSGWLGENCSLPEIMPAMKDSTLFVKCDYLRGINSIGIRLWLMWIKTLTANGFIRFEFDSLRSPILKQASLIQGFIPENGSVNSFYLSYWCEELNEEREFKMVRGKEYSTTKMRVPKIREMVENGKKVFYELDCPTEKLLRFYKGSVDIVDEC